MPKKVKVKSYTRKVKGKKPIKVKGHMRTIDSKKSKGGLSFEQKMRKKGEVIIKVHDVVWNYEHLLRPEWGERPSSFYADWDPDVKLWYCASSYYDEHFNDTTINKVKNNIRDFLTDGDYFTKKIGKITIQ